MRVAWVVMGRMRCQAHSPSPPAQNESSCIENTRLNDSFITAIFFMLPSRVDEFLLCRAADRIFESETKWNSIIESNYHLCTRVHMSMGEANVHLSNNSRIGGAQNIHQSCVLISSTHQNRTLAVILSTINFIYKSICCIRWESTPITHNYSFTQRTFYDGMISISSRIALCAILAARVLMFYVLSHSNENWSSANSRAKSK